MACSKETITLIHRYLDEELTSTEAKALEAHVASCPSCSEHLKELQRTVAIVQSSSHFKAPENLTANVMKQLPKQAQRKKWQHFLKRHPFALTAATFFLVFLLSLSSAIGGDSRDIVVQGDGQFIVNEAEGTVIVPEGERIEGNVVVRNGNIEVHGEVVGDITVINGRSMQASTQQITGEIEEINEIMERIWFETKGFFRDVLTFGDRERNEEE
ncbi:anti-sigma factor [Paenalkalicoccus suaedae]|uniref:Anti-sigma-W factor RsiW n=1 Tax=Paenalkalicoccus suaedae TaxID=2592382 RepID=A0A859FC14_9BACI|nr:zf-HC2 domain-containing protein [Paenalkalicoccus suaedae]QKS69825.1 anti-sigma factor [Paenalkalicoccus suaedae]